MPIRTNWTNKEETRQSLTERVAASFASVAQALRERGHDPQAVAHFVNRLDDVGLLPDHMFTRMLRHALPAPARFGELAGELFRAMASGGRVGFETVDWFNGSLFNDDTTLRPRSIVEEQLPESLADSRTAERLAEVCGLDLDVLDVVLPRGFGRELKRQAHDAHAGIYLPPRAEPPFTHRTQAAEYSAGVGRSLTIPLPYSGNQPVIGAAVDRPPRQADHLAVASADILLLAPVLEDGLDIRPHRAEDGADSGRQVVGAAHEPRRQPDVEDGGVGRLTLGQVIQHISRAHGGATPAQVILDLCRCGGGEQGDESEGDGNDHTVDPRPDPVLRLRQHPPDSDENRDGGQDSGDDLDVHGSDDTHHAGRPGWLRPRRRSGPSCGRRIRRARPKRWADAVDQLRTLQAEYEVEGVCDVDLDALDVELPRGFGRD